MREVKLVKDYIMSVSLVFDPKNSWELTGEPMIF